jgi:hypothetical protein
MPITTTPSGGPQGEFSTYTPIYAQTISSNTSSITFSNIPTTFTDLVLEISVISTSTNNHYINLQYNGDMSSSYSTTILSGDGTSALSARFSNRTDFNIDYYAAPHTQIGTRSVQIMNYSNNTTFKTGLVRSDRAGRGTDAMLGVWRSTAPITSIKITHDTAQFAAGSSITLYGIKAAATQFIPTKAAGGDVVTSDGTYAYHTFYTSGNFIPAQSLTCDYLIVAGGGGSNGTAGAGAGAGGYRAFTSQSLTATTYAVVVGAGGTKGSPDGCTQGASSSFNGYTSAGGGSGGGHRANSGGAGGSGGGVGGAEGSGALGGQTVGAGNTPSTSPSQGNNGGLVNSVGRGGAGGGGAGAVGGNPTNDNGAAGGIGVNWLSLGTFYAGGGGGAAQNITSNGTASAGAGGNGGGGNGGGPASDGQPGAFGTGGGAGGGSYTYSPAGAKNGANGGSGIVIVRYTL